VDVLIHPKRLEIDLYSPVDTDPHKWSARVSIPVLCDFRSMLVSFGIKISTPKPWRMPNEFFDAPVYNELGEPLGSMREATIQRWDSGQFPTKVGVHRDQQIYPNTTTMMDNGYGERIEVELYANLRVRQRRYYGHLPIESVRGLRDEQTGYVVTNAFTTGELDFEVVEKEWTELGEGDSLPVEPVFTILGLHCYGVSA
jgi:hypothetical protein